MKNLKISFFAFIIIALSFTSCVSSYDTASSRHSHYGSSRNCSQCCTDDSQPLLFSIIELIGNL